MTFATCSKGARRALGAAFLAAAAQAAHAQDLTFGWDYSTMFGSGTYLLRGREVHVYRASFKAPLREPPDAPGGRPGLALLLPVGLGIDKGTETAPEAVDDDELKLATFLPGIAIELRPSERLTVRPSVQIGAGRELNVDGGRRDSIRLAAFGVRTRVRFDELPGRPALINGILWAGFEAKDTLDLGAGGTDGTGMDDGGSGETTVGRRRESLLRFTTAFEFHVPTPRWRFRGQPMYLMPHVMGERYYRPPSGLSLGDADAEPPLERESQIGVAAGREGGFKILFFRFDSVGVAYRFSGHNDGVRFYFNSVF